MPWLTLSKPALYALGLAVLLTLAGLGFWRGMAVIENGRAAAVESAIAGRDAHWREQIAVSNAAVERARADAAIRAAAAERLAADAEARARTHLDELEKKNAALPGADDCGLSLERGRLLDENR